MVQLKSIKSHFLIVLKLKCCQSDQLFENITMPLNEPVHLLAQLLLPLSHSVYTE